MKKEEFSSINLTVYFNKKACEKIVEKFNQKRLADKNIFEIRKMIVQYVRETVYKSIGLEQEKRYIEHVKSTRKPGRPSVKIPALIQYLTWHSRGGIDIIERFSESGTVFLNIIGYTRTGKRYDMTRQVAELIGERFDRRDQAISIPEVIYIDWRDIFLRIQAAGVQGLSIR
jgi:hypothetical protein